MKAGMGNHRGLEIVAGEKRAKENAERGIPEERAKDERLRQVGAARGEGRQMAEREEDGGDGDADPDLVRGGARGIAAESFPDERTARLMTPQRR